ncbi:hypothetical protein V2J09_002875 [Rumex salicifolius]
MARSNKESIGGQTWRIIKLANPIHRVEVRHLKGVSAGDKHIAFGCGFRVVLERPFEVEFGEVGAGDVVVPVLCDAFRA